MINETTAQLTKDAAARMVVEHLVKAINLSKTFTVLRPSYNAYVTKALRSAQRDIINDVFTEQVK